MKSLILLLSLASLYSFGQSFKKTQLMDSPAIKLERRVYANLNGNKQVIHLAFVNLRQATLRPVMARSGCRKISDMARAVGATVAINGTFFSKSCTPLNLLKFSGKIHGYNKMRKRGTSSLIISNRLLAKIRLVSAKENPSDAYHGIGGFPNLVSAGKVNVFPIEKTGFFNRRHPRTAVAVINPSELALITVDGRSPRSAGMTIFEMADFVAALGVHSAINLDGGGSTTMWYDRWGVINSPSDFWGERSVANGLAIIE